MEQNQSRDLPPEEVTDRQEPLFPDGETDGGQPPAVDEGENPDLEPSPAPLPPPYADMTGTGRIIFQVTTAGGAVPLEDAQVTVREYNPLDAPGEAGDTLAVLFSGGDGKTEMCIRDSLFSGVDGKTDPLTLPAPARSLSMEQAGIGAPLPFALYNAEVVLSGFYRQEYTRIPLFDGVTSIQRVDLVPLPAASAPEKIGQPYRDITEGAHPDL